ncbi:hypothetical protein [Priestia megaterium]|uniref:hypothetical protein n=1 Tax=Priestia megaterium TaxID=1404 RepID=UPI000CA179C1|nr:hypothetical protein [Priestia megaterium]AUO14773.1 hypothetical protein C0569_26155 [Priestia megaterium]
MNTNNLVAEVTAIISKEAPMNSTYEAPVKTVKEKVLGDKEMQEQLNDAWYVKHRGIAYNFGAAGINVIGEDAE